MAAEKQDALSRGNVQARLWKVELRRASEFLCPRQDSVRIPHRLRLRVAHWHDQVGVVVVCVHEMGALVTGVAGEVQEYLQRTAGEPQRGCITQPKVSHEERAAT